MTVTPEMMRPTGWFQIGWSGDIAPAGVAARRYFGQDVVVFRDEQGTLCVLDAYCRHMGAHLGHGGTVRDGRIVCPFHGWEWNQAGKNVHIPYEDRPYQGRTLRSWPVCERNGVIYLWHDVDGAPPSWEVPDLFTALGDDVADRSYHPAEPDGLVRCGVLRLNPYVVLDNVGDMAHFRTVHGTAEVPTVLDHGPDGHIFRLRLGFGKSWKEGASDGRATGDVLNIVQLGVGFSYSVLGGAKLPYIVIILSTTPVDNETSEMFQTVWLEQAPGDEEPGRLERRMHHACHQLPRDIQIWENQRYEQHPAWRRTEVRPFQAIRRWAQTFHPASRG